MRFWRLSGFKARRLYPLWCDELFSSIEKRYTHSSRHLIVIQHENPAYELFNLIILHSNASHSAWLRNGCSKSPVFAFRSAIKCNYSSLFFVSSFSVLSLMAATFSAPLFQINGDLQFFVFASSRLPQQWDSKFNNISHSLCRPPTEKFRRRRDEDANGAKEEGKKET